MLATALVFRVQGATENAEVEMNGAAGIRIGLIKYSTPEEQFQQHSIMLQNKPIKSCLSRLDSGTCNRLQFLLEVSHSMGAHAETFRQTDDSSNNNGGEDAETEEPTTTV